LRTSGQRAALGNLSAVNARLSRPADSR
jgi:hypothetical protein